MYKAACVLLCLFAQVSAAPVPIKYIAIVSVVVALILLVIAVRVCDAYHICHQIIIGKLGKFGRKDQEDDGNFEMKVWEGHGFGEPLSKSVHTLTPAGFQSRKYQPAPLQELDPSEEAAVKELLEKGLPSSLPKNPPKNLPKNPPKKSPKNPLKKSLKILKKSVPENRDLTKREKEEMLRKELEIAINKERIDPYHEVLSTDGRSVTEETVTYQECRKDLAPGVDRILSPTARRALSPAPVPREFVSPSVSKRALSPERTPCAKTLMSPRSKRAMSPDPATRTKRPDPSSDPLKSPAPHPPVGAVYPPYYHPAYPASSTGYPPCPSGAPIQPPQAYPYMHPSSTLPSGAPIQPSHAYPYMHPSSTLPSGAPIQPPQAYPYMYPYPAVPHPAFSPVQPPAPSDSFSHLPFPYPYPGYYPAPAAFQPPPPPGYKSDEEVPSQSHQTSQL